MVAGFEGARPQGQRFGRKVAFRFTLTTSVAMTHKDSTMSTPEEERKGPTTLWYQGNVDGPNVMLAPILLSSCSVLSCFQDCQDG